VNPAAPNQTVTTDIPYRFVQTGTINFTYSPHSAAYTEFNEAPFVTGDCQSGVQQNAGTECNFDVAFEPLVPGTRKGVIQVTFVPANGSQAEPILYLFLSGLGSAPQIALGDASQQTLNAALNQPQSLTFSPADKTNSMLYVANSNSAQIGTMNSSGGLLTPWNTANSGNLVYPTDLAFDAFADLIVTDANAAKVFSFSPTLAEQTVSTGTIKVGAPTATKVDLAGNLYIADGSNTPQIVMVPGETYDTTYKPSVLNLGSNSVSYPQALAVDNTGNNLYIGDGNTNQVLEVSLSGTGTSQVPILPCVTTGTTAVTPCAFNAPTGFAFDPNGDVYVTDGTPRLLMVPANHSSGGQTSLIPMTGLVNPSAVTLDGSGNIYVTDFIGTVTKLSVNAGTMQVTTLNTSQTTTVTNTGNLPLIIGTPTFANGTNSAFTVGGSCKGSTVAAGASCTIIVTYSKSGGVAPDTLTIPSNAFSATGVTIQVTH
jgi:hypothetical protein